LEVGTFTGAAGRLVAGRYVLLDRTDGMQACGRVGGVRFTMAGLETHQAGKDPG
jgi:hypothetical protein